MSVSSRRLPRGHRPGYQPINNFLRQISGLSGAIRQELLQHTSLTLATTIGNLISAVRKLSAVATDEESEMPLYRGVRGTLPKGFWQPDETGIVVRHGGPALRGLLSLRVDLALASHPIDTASLLPAHSSVTSHLLDSRCASKHVVRAVCRRHGVHEVS